MSVTAGKVGEVRDSDLEAEDDADACALEEPVVDGSSVVGRTPDDIGMDVVGRCGSTGRFGGEDDIGLEGSL